MVEVNRTYRIYAFELKELEFRQIERIKHCFGICESIGMIAVFYDRVYDIFAIKKEDEWYSEYLSFSEKCFKNSIEQLRKKIPLLRDTTHKEIACVVLSAKLARKQRDI